ncbi:MAG TPA: ribonuclease III domain-containing protein [Kamptonema sp.]|nr:ribonuclease III domain-containing protein [Kamptonema sp.]
MPSIADDQLGLSPAISSFNLLRKATEIGEIERISPASWAYLGDAVYELFVRMSYIVPPKRSQAYHELVVAQVRAETQARHLRSLSPHLSTRELEIVKRGRNAADRHPKRLDPEIYQQATSLETLVGYLYVTDPERLNQLLALLELEQ